MFFANPITGNTLPSKTLCLTYDDGPGETAGAGPGPRTLAIAECLARYGVRATFFACGKHVEQFPHLLPQMQSYGHLIGNHTYDHPNLVKLLATGGDVVEQVARTGQLLRRYGSGNTTYFRAPYLKWSPELAEVLNDEVGSALGHVGPISADLNTRDWAYWAQDRSPGECAAAFVRSIGRNGSGIVLMHDSTADGEAGKSRCMTHRLTEILVPRLLDMGYQFARLDEIPGVIAATQVSLVCGVRGPNGRCATPRTARLQAAAAGLHLRR